MAIFAFLKRPKIIETKTFSEIPGFSFNYPVFKGWEVNEIKKINEDEYYIFFKTPLLTGVAPSMKVKKSLNTNYQYTVPGLPYSVNPNKIRYYPIGGYEDPQSNEIVFFDDNDSFAIKIRPYMHEGDGYSGKILTKKIIDSFKFTCSPESIGAVPLSELVGQNLYSQNEEIYLKAVGAEAVIEKLKQDKENPDDFYAKVSRDGQNLVFELSHKDDFKPENCNKPGNPSGKSRNVYYDLGLKKVTKTGFWK